MPELKPDLKTPGAIRLMDLDTSTLFLPFGRPIADYLRGAEGNQNGTRALLKQGSIDFSPAIRWSEFTSSGLGTTGFGELEREALEESAAAVEADPGRADFLPFTQPGVSGGDSNQARRSPAIAPQPNPVSLPRM